jgi:hypothetical protein
MIQRHSLTCTQFIDRADAYALGTLDELERHACSRHIARLVHHHGCREALQLAQDVVDRLAAALPAGPPPAGLWQSIEARLGAGTGPANAEWL